MGNDIKEITIGEIHLKSDGSTLTIARLNQPNITLNIDAKGVEELIDFVTSLTETKFNRRRNFRVPLWDSSGLSVQIRKDEKQLSATPKDISVIGIFVELRPDDWLDLKQDDDLEVILEFEGETQTYRAVVRRCEDNGYGLLFPESMKGNQINPPTELKRIVMKLQCHWLARRIR